MPTRPGVIPMSDGNPEPGPPAEFLPHKVPGDSWMFMGLYVCVLNVILAVLALWVGILSIPTFRNTPFVMVSLMVIPVTYIFAGLSILVSMPLSIVAAAKVRKYGHRSMMLAILISMTISMANVVNAIVFYVATGMVPFKFGLPW